ncbi:carboxylesterase 1-like [Tripterygium wilfordii]|uniref:Carboxylesterase 1-like n=1 Tax=Tripterygium wilfordii TaxID=458696 RepID=A0A7J7CH83_TRIWF|nr:carboxylesterase 1-like [Tripterygium wilfordii]
MWDMSLPIGANRDHEYCNPTVGDDGKKLWDKVGLLGWKVLVIGCNGDPLIDRQISLVEMLKGKGVQVEHQFDEGGDDDIHQAKRLLPAIARLPGDEMSPGAMGTGNAPSAGFIYKLAFT